MKDVSFLEKNGVDVSKITEVFGSVDDYNKSLGKFIADIHSKMEELINYMNNNDLADYVTCVHLLKSTAKDFGFNKLTAIAYEHERRSKAGDLSFVTSHINDLIRETNSTILLIQEYTGESSKVEKKDKSEVQEVVGEVYDKKTILVVDDSSIIRNFVKRIFSDDYNVGSAENGEEAINIIKANKDNCYIEAILLDLNMPKVDGFAVLEYMQENGLLKKMPVSIISGDSSKKTVEKAFSYQIVDMLEKPFNNQSVKMVVEKTLFYKEMN